MLLLFNSGTTVDFYLAYFHIDGSLLVLKMSFDTLTVTSRAFYERSKAKVAISIIVGAAALLLLGFCSVAGGNSAANNELYSGEHFDDHSKNAQSQLAGGYGKISSSVI